MHELESFSKTKRRIFEVSAELFAEKGYANASMRDIAEGVGVKAASLYNHYDSKEDILADIIHFYQRRIVRFMKEMNRADLDRIPATVDAFADLMDLRYDPESLDLMFHTTRVVYQVQFTNAEAEDSLLGSYYQRYLVEYKRIFQHLQDRGLMGAQWDVATCAETITRFSMTYNEQFIHPKVQPSAIEVGEMYRFFLRLVLDPDKLEG